jgi:hypothetical protein
MAGHHQAGRDLHEIVHVGGLVQWGSLHQSPEMAGRDTRGPEVADEACGLLWPPELRKHELHGLWGGRHGGRMCPKMFLYHTER